MRIAAHSIVQRPVGALLAAAVLSLGLCAAYAVVRMGTGISASVLSLPDSAQLALVVEAPQLHPNAIQAVPPSTFRLWSGTELATARLAAYVELELPWSYFGQRHTDLHVAAVTANFFGLVGATAARGRLPVSQGEVIVRPQVARRIAGSEAAALGRVVEIGHRTFVVVGVMGSARFPVAAAAWVLNPYRAHTLEESTPPIYPDFQVIARIQGNGSRSALAAALNAANGGSGQLRVRVLPLGTGIFFNEGRWLAGAYMIAGVLLLLALFGFGAYLFACAAERSEEMTIRAALGASRMRLTLLIASDGAQLGLVAAICSVFGSSWLAWWIRSLGAGDAWAGVGAWRIGGIIAALVVGVLCGILCGIASAWRFSRKWLDLSGGLHIVGRRGYRAGRALIVMEVGGCVALSCAALSLGLGLWRVLEGHPGYEAGGAYTFKLALSGNQAAPATTARLLHEILGQVGNLPGVKCAGAINLFPLDGDEFPTSISIPGGGRNVNANVAAVTPRFFEAMGIRLAGKTLRWSRRDAVLSRGLSRALWGERSPIGRQISVMGEVYTVVGIADNIETGVAGDLSPNRLYVPWDRSPMPWSSMTMIIRSGDSLSVGELEGAVAASGALASVEHFEPLLEVRRHNAAAATRAAGLLGFAALFSFLLSAGAVWTSTIIEAERRVRENGLRLALGARPGDLAVAILSRAARTALWAALVGVPVALVLTTIIERMLQMQGLATTFAFTAGTLSAMTAAIASSAPAALRARRSDPATLLRAP